MGFITFLQSYFAEFALARFIGILVVVFLIARISLWFFKKIVETQLKKVNDEIQEKIVVKLETPLVLILILAGVEIAARQITLSIQSFHLLINSAIVFVIAYMFIGVMDLLIKYWEELHHHKEHEFVHGEMLPLVRSIAKIIFVLIAVVLVLQIWGVEIGALLASLGVIGVILGFAFQDSMKNILGGISLSMDNSLNNGDVIKLDTGEMGEVTEINFRSTKIKTFDNDMFIVPNGLLANSKFHNFAQPRRDLRIVIPVNVAYGSDVSQVRELLLACIEDDESILPLPMREVRFMKMGDYSLEFDLLFFIKNYRDKYYIINRVTERIYNELNKAQINIPFPTQQIYIKKDLTSAVKNTCASIVASLTPKKSITKKGSPKKKTTKNSFSKKK